MKPAHDHTPTQGTWQILVYTPHTPESLTGISERRVVCELKTPESHMHGKKKLFRPHIHAYLRRGHNLVHFHTHTNLCKSMTTYTFTHTYLCKGTFTFTHKPAGGAIIYTFSHIQMQGHNREHTRAEALYNASVNIASARIGRSLHRKCLGAKVFFPLQVHKNGSIVGVASSRGHFPPVSPS
jgi:hypothetical protein